MATEKINILEEIDSWQVACPGCEKTYLAAQAMRIVWYNKPRGIKVGGVFCNDCKIFSSGFFTSVKLEKIRERIGSMANGPERDKLLRKYARKFAKLQTSIKKEITNHANISMGYEVKDE